MIDGNKQTPEIEGGWVGLTPNFAYFLLRKLILSSVTEVWPKVSWAGLNQQFRGNEGGELSNNGRIRLRSTQIKCSQLVKQVELSFTGLGKLLKSDTKV